MPDHFYSNTPGLSLLELKSVDSTNNYARRLINDGRASHGQAVFAHYQTVGKGQRGKLWISEKGKNIILSILLNPHPLHLLEQFQLNACMAISLHQFFFHFAGNQTKIKWPNDIYWQDRKAGGMLIESIIGSSLLTLQSPESAVQSQESHSNWKWAIVGLGVNINQTTFDSLLPNPVSLKQITGKTFNVIELAKELRDIVLKNFQLLIENGFEDFLKNYNHHLYKKDQTVKFKKDNRVFESTVKSVSMEGKLITEHGIEEQFEFGAVEWLL